MKGTFVGGYMSPEDPLAMKASYDLGVDPAYTGCDRTVFGTFSFFKIIDGATVIDIEATVIKDEPKQLE